jgi:PAS domain S-box-containing protein
LNLRLFNRIVRQVLIFPILALFIVGAALYWEVNASSGTVDRIEDSDEAIAQSNLIGRLIIDEESGLRGYVATGDDRFLEPYKNAVSAFPGSLKYLDERNLDDDEKKQIARLVADHEIWLESFAAPLIAETRARGGGEPQPEEQARDLTLNLEGRRYMDQVRSDLAAVIKADEIHRGRRVAHWRAQVRDMVIGLIGLAVMIGLFIGLFTRNRLHVVSSAYRNSVETLQQKNDELFHSEQQLRTTLASIGDGVITCDAEGRVRMMNQVASDLTGWSIEEALGRPLEAVFQVLDATTGEPVEDPVSKVKARSAIGAVASESILVRKNCTELDISDNGAPIRDQSGAITGIVLVFRDVTMEKRTRQALVSSEKLAVAGRLAASIAHEIHNPLDAVSNMLYLMSSGTSPEENAQFVAMAQQEIARVTQISRSMLSLYRESTAPVPVNIKDILDSTLVLLDHMIHENRCSIATSFSGDLTVSGFPSELRQVFTNLVVNAIEAAGDEGKIVIEATHLPPGSNRHGERREDGVLVEVVDSGPGIDESASPNLFQPFFSTKGEQGTGLGLWVSRGIIRKHGGSINLLSRPDTHGAIARVFLATVPVISPGAD